jgi:hypothetical protein
MFFFGMIIQSSGNTAGTVKFEKNFSPLFWVIFHAMYYVKGKSQTVCICLLDIFSKWQFFHLFFESVGRIFSGGKTDAKNRRTKFILEPI